MKETREITIPEVREHLDAHLPCAEDRVWESAGAGGGAWLPGIAPFPDVVDLFPVRVLRGQLEGNSEGVTEVREEISEELVAIARFLGEQIGWLDESSEVVGWTDDDWEDADADDIPLADFHRAIDVWEQVAAPLRCRGGEVVSAAVSNQFGGLPILSTLPVGLYLHHSTLEATEMRNRAIKAEKQLQAAVAVAMVGWVLALLLLAA